MAFDPGGELTGWDLTGFHEGHDTEAWRRLGAHEVNVTDSERGQVAGTRFSVWAPNAQAVRLVGDFNYWNGDSSPMHLVPGSGVWSLFVEGVGTGALYKFEVLGGDGVWRLKADPFARFCEAPPHNASIVYESQYTWTDEQWLWFRGQKKQYEEPVSIYEVHLGSWRKGLTYVELARQLVEYVTWQGFTHVEFMPVAEHPFDGSWGYHVTGYFAPISRFGSPDEFRYLVDELHKAGIGVLVDWVPGHFATDPWALQRFDGTALYEHEDPRLGWHPDWGSYIFNFGRNEVKAFLISNAYYWLDEFHIDGLRIDAVASMLYLDYSREAGQWVPNKYGGNENLEAVELLQRVNEHNYRRKPGIMMVAEESTSWPGRDPVHRQRRPRFRLQVEHGLDERLVALLRARADLPAVPPPRDDVRHGVRVLGELRAADQPRRGRARQGLDVRTGFAGRVAQVRHHAGLLRLHVGASRARSCCSWAPSSASAGSSPNRAASTGIRAPTGATGGCSGWSRT